MLTPLPKIEPLNNWLEECRKSPRYEASIKTIHRSITNITDVQERYDFITDCIKNRQEELHLFSTIGRLWDEMWADPTIAMQEINSEIKTMNSDQFERDRRSFCIGLLAREELQILQADTLHELSLIKDSQVPPHMPAGLSRDTALKFYNFLVNGQFISANTPQDLFLYYMGASNERPLKLSPITWLKNKQLLREAIQGGFAKHFKNKIITKVEMERIVTFIFVDKHGKEIRLPHDSPKDTVMDSDFIKDFWSKTHNVTN